MSVGGVEDAVVSVVVVSVGVEEAVVVSAACGELLAVSVVVAVDVVDDAALGSITLTVREAMPVWPAWSVALYTIVCVPAAEVSTIIASMVVVAPPSTDA